MICLQKQGLSCEIEMAKNHWTWQFGWWPSLGPGEIPVDPLKWLKTWPPTIGDQKVTFIFPTAGIAGLSLGDRKLILGPIADSHIHPFLKGRVQLLILRILQKHIQV